MRIAITHDFIRTIGGTERVLNSLLKIFPQADVYTLSTSKSALKYLKLNASTLYSSPINRIKILENKNSIVQLLAPFLWSAFKLKNYDLIISNSSFGLSNTIKTGDIPHIQYIQSYPKNLYDPSEKLAFQKFFPYHLLLRKIYEKAIHKSPYILTNSKHMQSVLQKMFNVNSKVIYPPVIIPPNPPKRNTSGKYYLYIGRLDRTKSIDVAIMACNKLKIPFKIIGEGPDLNRLKNMSGPTNEFLGFVPDQQLKKYYKMAKAFLFCAKNEDFGIAPIEAMAHGIPIISYYGGGVKETLLNKKTGIFFYNHTVESLIESIIDFDKHHFNSDHLRKYVEKFSERRFISEFASYERFVLKKSSSPNW